MSRIPTKAEILGYGWVLETKCGPIPSVDWWKYDTHESIANYVERKKSGDWETFVESLRVRLIKLQDIADRNSAVVTKSEVVLLDEDPLAYISKFAQRLDVVRCLADEAKLASGQ